MFEHEQVTVTTGRRSKNPIVIAVHSTRLGQAVGGCRIKQYRQWEDGLRDAMRLSAAMTDKCAAAGLPLGGGKTVVVIYETKDKRDALLDVGDAIEALGGRYATGPDIGTGPDEMDVIAERTENVFCRPPEHGGSGDSSGHTADGIIAALNALGSNETYAIIGLGNVGARVARALSGRRLIVADVDPAKRKIAEELGATWTTPEKAMQTDVDVLVPAALGGILTPSSVETLNCKAICGPANNQLDRPETAELLHERKIVWVPDYIASAGGVIYASAIEILKESDAAANRRVEAIGETVQRIIEDGRAPYVAAKALIAARLQSTV